MHTLLVNSKESQDLEFQILDTRVQTLLRIYRGPVALHWEQMMNCTGFVHKLPWEGNMQTANHHTG